MRNDSGEVIGELDSVSLLQDKSGGASTTLAAAANIGDTTITVASAVGIADGDRLRISAGNLIEEVVVDGAPVGAVVTVRDALAFAHQNGAAVVEREEIDIGLVTDEGCRVGRDSNETVLRSATHGFVTRLCSYADYLPSWAVHGADLEHIAYSHGIDPGDIAGAGTEASPSRLVVDYKKERSLRNISVALQGTREDGTTHRVEFWGAELTPTGEVTYNTGSGVPTPLSAIAGRKAYYQWA